MKIRKAAMKDAKRILELLNSSENLVFDKKIKFDLMDVKDYFEKKLNKIYVCEFGGKIAGVFIAQFWKNYVHAHLAAVDKKYQGKGIGKNLMDFMEEMARKDKKREIDSFVEINNKRMQKILKMRGYHEGKTFKSFYKILK